MTTERKQEQRRAYRSLAEYFEKTGELQEDFAAALDISAGYVSLIAAGKRRPSLTLALLIAEKANIPIESLQPEEQVEAAP